MTPIEIIATAHVAATLIVGAGQIGIVWVGIRAMNRSTDERARDRRQHARALDALIRQTDANTLALRELIDRTAAK